MAKEKSYRKGEIYLNSSELITIINKHGWTLLDAKAKGKKAPSWKELETRGPAEAFRIGESYIFAPVPERGMGLRSTYQIATPFKPSLTVDSPDEERWKTLYVKHGRSRLGIPIPFTRLVFFKEALAATYPANEFDNDPDVIGVDYAYVIDTFQKYFRIASLDECLLHTFHPNTLDPKTN